VGKIAMPVYFVYYYAMIETIINETNIAEADVVVVSAAYEKTASSHKGTAAGPAAVIEQLDHQIEFFDRDFQVKPTNFIKTAHYELKDIEQLSPEEAFNEIKTACSNLLTQNKFIFLLGGEHAVSFGHFKALSEKYDSKDITILQIDAHCDLRDTDSDFNDTNPSIFSHGAIMRRASELGYHIVQVGIRTYSEEEHAYFSDSKNNITVFEWGQKSIPTIEDILKTIQTKYLYISIDVDGFDPAHMPGTGTAVQGGLEWWYGVHLITKAIDTFELVGADIVEVSPLPDSVLSEYGAAQLLYIMIAHKFQSKFK
jgi:agmatinase